MTWVFYQLFTVLTLSEGLT